MFNDKISNVMISISEKYECQIETRVDVVRKRLEKGYCYLA